ncbi:DNA alkylation repair protein [Flavobacterium granuli]|uniref:3-methyladenine DNA glycosylase AlkD n=1 Tax=Flavobacterium granuli TaxID=280093 RepID=A0ABU1S003_9FLAO|nr:DNA alkylation repair protein [Flavobacterium granuli]MDR6844368.1 3-methyladenine DNA glycosylase AlkD [Flavobacterium granuli]
MNFIPSLEKAFTENSNAENAVAMSKYMKNNFQFFGIKTEERRQIFKKIWIENQKEVSDNPREIALFLYSKKERELHYCALEILIKSMKKNYIKEDIQLIEKIIINNSWWDSVDVIAKFILGDYLQQFPLETNAVISHFSNSENMWLNRSVILFQLGYKEKTNFDLLKSVCEKHKTSTEFFIQKAIGWALREFAKTDSEAVENFVSVSKLKKLSKKEALKNIK